MLFAALGHGLVYSYASYETGKKKTMLFAVRDIIPTDVRPTRARPSCPLFSRTIPMSTWVLRPLLLDQRPTTAPSCLQVALDLLNSSKHAVDATMHQTVGRLAWESA